MNKEFSTTNWVLTSLFSFLVFFSNVCGALPFSIVSKVGTVLPTTIHAGGSATAFYTITNNTTAQRNSNFVKWLPPGVTQVTSNGLYNDTCGSAFSLAGKGQAGDSCTLQLNILGAVSSSDPNPQHHIFACFPGGQTCAGTNDSLNVKASSSPAFAYITDEQTNIVNLCQVNTKGSFGSCSNLGNPGGTFNEPTGITLNNSSTMAYVANGIFSNTPTTVSLCSIIADGEFSTCVNSGSNTFHRPTSITLNNVGTIAYVTNSASGANTVSLCPIIAGGAFGTCVDSGNTGLPFNEPFGLAINSASTIAYVTNSGSGTVSICPINPSGIFGDCEPDVNYPGDEPYGIALNSGGSIAYIVDGNTADSVFACPITPNGSFGTCVNAADSISDGLFFSYGGIALNQASTVAYLAFGDESVFYTCAITNGGMSFGTCTPASFTKSFGVALN